MIGFQYLVLSLFPLQLVPSDNLIQNPSFEEGLEAPAEWVFWTRTDGVGTWDRSVARTGQASVRIRGSDSNDNWSQRGIPIAPGYLYRFRVWIKQERCYPWGPDVVVTAVRADGTVLQSWQFRGRRGTRDWYPLEDFIVPPANAASVRIELRLLHLTGTCWFEDVTLERVGSWSPPIEARDPPAEQAKKQAYLRRLSTEVRTPHRRWADRVWNPPEVFFALDRLAQREIVELVQRFPLPWRTTFLTSEPIAKYMTGEYYDRLTLEELQSAFREALEEPWQVIVLSGSVWDGLDDAARKRTLQKVAEGAALVYLGRPLDINRDDPLATALGVRWTNREVQARCSEGTWLTAAHPPTMPSFPLHVLEVTDARVCAEAIDENGQRHPLIVERPLGAGRTLTVAYRTEGNLGEVRGAGLTPLLTRAQHVAAGFDYHEYLLANVFRWLLYAAQPERWFVQSLQIQRTPAGIQGKLDFRPPGRALEANCTWRDSASRVIANARHTVRPNDTHLLVPLTTNRPVPPGHLFLEVTVTDGGALVDCCVSSLRIEGLRFTVRPDHEVVPGGRALSGTIEVIGLPGTTVSPYKVVLEVMDCYGWLWERRELAWKPEAGGTSMRFSVPLHRLRASGGVLSATLKDRNGNILAAQRLEILKTRQNAWDDWRQVLWTVFGRSGYRPYYWEAMARQLRAMGFDTWLFNVHGEEWRTASRYDFHLVPIGVYGVPSSAWGFNEYAVDGDRSRLHRKPACPNTPQEQVNAVATIQGALQRLGNYGPLAYCLSDENNLTYFNAPFDWCICPSCLTGFRNWLQTRYTTLQALNEAWHRSYQSWNEVTPDTFEEARDRAVWTSWADHRAYMDGVFVDVWRRIRQAAQERDRTARLAISGTPAPEAYGGYDWYPLAQQFDALFSYTDYFAEGLARAPWTGGYEVSGPQLSYGIWNAVFRGCDGVSAFWLPSLLEPDLTWPKCSRDLEQVTRPLRHGLGKLLIHARQTPAQVAIYHSMPSLRAAFALGLDEELAAERDAFVTLLRSLGISVTLVDARQVEEGWLLQHRPKLLILPVALAMSEREVAALKEYLARGGKVLADLPPARFNERLAPYTTNPLGLSVPARQDPPAEARFGLETGTVNASLPPASGGLWCLQSLPLATHLRESSWRGCPEIDERCRERERWLRRVVAWAGLRPPLAATTPNGQAASDLIWAEWDLGGGRLVGVLRSASAAGSEQIRLDLPPGAFVPDVLSGKPADPVFQLAPGEVRLFAILREKPGRPKLTVRQGTLRAGDNVHLRVTVPGAPSLTVLRLEMRDARGKPLDGFAQNVLLRQGTADIRMALPYNLPQACRIVVRDVASGQTAEVGGPWRSARGGLSDDVNDASRLPQRKGINTN